MKKKRLIYLLFWLFGLFNFGYASSFMEDGKLNLVEDKKYVIVCIEGTKWVQFLEKNNTHYYPSGNPVQIFIKANAANVNIPLMCNENQK